MRFEDSGDENPMGGTDWTPDEVRATVADYLAMLHEEQGGRPYNKAAHRRALAATLDGRSEKAIEFKHANISAALDDLGHEYIRGYKPRSHYQQSLRDELLQQLGAAS